MILMSPEIVRILHGRKDFPAYMAVLGQG